MSSIPAHAQKVFEGKIFDVYQWPQTLFDGSTVTFERLKRSDTVSILPITDDGQVLFAKEEQPGTPSFLGTFGGRVEEGEAALRAAQRELLEETGYKAEHWEAWFTSEPSSKIVWQVHVFIARGLTKVAEPTLDPGEKIEVNQVSIENFLREIVSDPLFRDKDLALHVFQHFSTPIQRQQLMQKLLQVQ